MIRTLGLEVVILDTEIHKPPFVSVIMPVRNEQDAIRRSVCAVLSQDYPADSMEILVADGLSEDNTRAIVSMMAEKDLRVRLIDNDARVMASGFNKALSFARGKVILMLGGHTELSKSYISRCVAILQEKRADCVGGVIETVSETNGGEAIALALTSSFGVGGVDFRVGTTHEKYVDTVAFGAYTRDIINRAGVLDDSFVRNQDDEYNYRLRKLGARILLVPDIYCRYYSRSSLGSLWCQYFQYGYWKVRVMQKHPKQMRARHFVPAAFVSALTLSLLIAPFSFVARWILGLVLCTYLFANLTATLQEARREKWHVFIFLPLTFAILHLSYGSGFLVGLVRFISRWGNIKNPVSEREYSKII